MYNFCANLCPWRVNWAAMARKEGVAARALSVTESDTDLGEHVTFSAPANTVALRKSSAAAVVVVVLSKGTNKPAHFFEFQYFLAYRRSQARTQFAPHNACYFFELLVFFLL